VKTSGFVSSEINSSRQNIASSIAAMSDASCSPLMKINSAHPSQETAPQVRTKATVANVLAPQVGQGTLTGRGATAKVLVSPS
jgi:hypothetical protein